MLLKVRKPKSDIVGLLDSLKNIYNQKLLAKSRNNSCYKDKDFFGLSIDVNDIDPYKL